MSSCIRYATAAGIIDDMKLYVCTCIYMRVCGVCVHACVHTTAAGIVGDMKLYICMFECAYMRACVCVCAIAAGCTCDMEFDARARACVCVYARARVCEHVVRCMHERATCVSACTLIHMCEQAREKEEEFHVRLLL